MPRIKKNSNKPVKYIGLELEQDVFAELEKYCKAHNCTKAFFLRELIKGELKKEVDKVVEFLKK